MESPGECWRAQVAGVVRERRFVYDRCGSLKTLPFWEKILSDFNSLCVTVSDVFVSTITTCNRCPQ